MPSPVAPRLCGVVNITPDSFSDGGQFLDPDKALAHARALLSSGADIIELGPASSAPDAPRLTPEIEIARLSPVLAELAGSMTLSVDSYQTEVQRFALGYDVAMLNDVHGFADESFYPELADASCQLVVMHALQQEGSADRRASPVEIIPAIMRFFDERLAALVKAGIAEERLILDPGMGLFLGNRASASFAVLRALKELRRHYGLPMMISVSRKSFLRRKGQMPQEAATATLAAELYAASAGVEMIRTHDPANFLEGWRIWREVADITG